MWLDGDNNHDNSREAVDEDNAYIVNRISIYLYYAAAFVFTQTK